MFYKERERERERFRKKNTKIYITLYNISQNISHLDIEIFHTDSEIQRERTNERLHVIIFDQSPNMRGRGRGAYYREKYGGGRSRGRGRGRGRGGGGGRGGRGIGSIERTSEGLRRALGTLDNQGYGAYKSLVGSYEFKGNVPFTLSIDRVQSDAYAPPSTMHIEMSLSDLGLGDPFFISTRCRRVALCDWLTRRFAYTCKESGVDQSIQGEGRGNWKSAKGGALRMYSPGQHVLERSSVIITSRNMLQARFTVSLPARGRSICGHYAASVLTEKLPRIVQVALYAKQYDRGTVSSLQNHIRCVEDQETLRAQISSAGLVAFVRDGAILPRKSGADDGPMSKTDAVPFKSPESMRCEFKLPNCGVVSGMGIRRYVLCLCVCFRFHDTLNNNNNNRGVTLICGGGFHGKSTLLKALEVGCYNHIPNDGREFVVTSRDAVKIRAEDGRSVTNLDISPFINNLPFKRATTKFSTPDASGSTSQAANICEALQVGATTLLIDEDTCATNFMIRDQRMEALIRKDKEPITPYLWRVRSLFEDLGVSSIMGTFLSRC